MIPLLPSDVSTKATEPVLVGEMPCATDNAFAFADILDELSEPDVDAEETPVFAMLGDLILDGATGEQKVQQSDFDGLKIDDAPVKLPIPDDVAVKHDAVSVVAVDAQKHSPNDIGVTKQIVMPKMTAAQSIVEGCIPLPAPDDGVLGPRSIAILKSSIEPEKQAQIPAIPKPVAHPIRAERFVEAVDSVARVAEKTVTSEPAMKIDSAPRPDTILKPFGYEPKPSFDTAPATPKMMPSIVSEPPTLEASRQVIDAENGAFWIPDKGVSQHIQPTSSAVSIPNADTVRQVANQLSVAVTEHAGKPTEIALNPEELGRVRLSMSVVENAITLSISAERQETTDLMRRHIETLAQEFRDLGYSDVSFAFGQDNRPEQSANTDAGVEVDENTETAQVADPHTTQMIVTSGLDIRL
ncbi:flagellar hook-length control protein FliK [Yoonia maritima]|uniref:flagellar hook-length control protein FliK n=1 Tax=Yoonia maritima TaxID=1435347 RepID=UPI000D1051D6|nr:flagellar hook-length control protein FliK [Yoonia maritima]